MPIEYRISVKTLRRIIVALQQRGETFKKNSLTAYQELGQGWLDLAKDLDIFVEDASKIDQVVVLRSEAELQRESDEETRQIQQSHDTLKEIKRVLEVDPIQGDVYNKVQRLLLVDSLFEKAEDEMIEVKKALGLSEYVANATVLSNIRSLMSANQIFQKSSQKKATKRKKR